MKKVKIYFGNNEEAKLDFTDGEIVAYIEDKMAYEEATEEETEWYEKYAYNGEVEEAGKNNTYKKIKRAMKKEYHN
ncbi:hypothetical protein BEH_07325 [Priestia filamentosa]|uniref:Uncharacterized protein n=1 Tax=Priestia filamentosa TaxID=1402861 RepID=A0A0H4KCU1_9BACI|nr:hypothetical protein [Priestia filamentosa]AKO91927.1 hypothetical protein BEH_07325 [Priestia filamentosa]